MKRNTLSVIKPVFSVSLVISITLGLFCCDRNSGVKNENFLQSNQLMNKFYIENSNVEVKDMNKNECSIEYDSSLNAFIVKLLGNITKQNIYECHQNFEKAINEYCDNKKFNILLYMDYESHTLENVKLIRFLTSTPNFQNSLKASAAVFPNSPNPGINGNEGNFSTTEDAVEFLKQKY